MAYHYSKVTSLNSIVRVGDTNLFLSSSVYCHKGDTNPEYFELATEGTLIRTGAGDVGLIQTVSSLVQLIQEGNLFTRTEEEPTEKYVKSIFSEKERDKWRSGWIGRGIPQSPGKEE